MRDEDCQARGDWRGWQGWAREAPKGLKQARRRADRFVGGETSQGEKELEVQGGEVGELSGSWWRGWPEGNSGGLKWEGRRGNRG